MNEMEGLRAKVAETRSAALRLSLLLDELEISFRNSEADELYCKAKIQSYLELFTD